MLFEIKNIECWQHFLVNCQKLHLICILNNINFQSDSSVAGFSIHLFKKNPIHFPLTNLKHVVPISFRNAKKATAAECGNKMFNFNIWCYWFWAMSVPFNSVVVVAVVLWDFVVVTRAANQQLIDVPRCTRRRHMVWCRMQSQLLLLAKTLWSLTSFSRKRSFR